LAGKAHGANRRNDVGVSVRWIEDEVTADDEHPISVPTKAPLARLTVVTAASAGVESLRHLYREDGKVAIKLHRCPNMWVKISGHPCWRVQKALDDQGIDYEVVKGPLRRGQRDALEKLSGQRQYPVIELDNGTVYRAESKDMAAKIRGGGLLEGDAPVG
jgi:glutaredoxin